MVAFPTTIAAPSIVGFQETVTRPILRTETEAGYVLTAARSFDARSTWKMEWKAMSQEDKDLLFAFYKTYTASIFQWYNWDNKQTYDVRFEVDGVDFVRSTPTCWAVSIAVKEV